MFSELIRRSRTVTSASCLLVFLSAGNLPAAETPGKAAWQWTTEERIAKRVNPAERDARRVRTMQKGRSAAPGWSPIDGSIEPELFLPIELVESFVLNTRGANAPIREIYRAAITARGWDYDQFWAVLHSAAAPYLAGMEQSAILARQKSGRTDLTHLRLQVCSASADLLATAYKTFGQQKFDEFLYRTVAPQIRTSIADRADTADSLRSKVGGCR